MSSDVLAVEQLAQIIHKSPSSIRSDASRNPAALPPICRLPGNKRLLWRREDVQDWLALHVERIEDSHATASVTSPDSIARKRGRPRNVASSTDL